MEFGARLKGVIGEEGIHLYRLHADQYAILCREGGDVKAYEERIRKILRAIVKEPILLIESKITLGVTVGLAVGSGSGLLIQADIALKRAKTERKEMLIYDEDFKVTEEYRRNMEWTSKLKKALDENRVVAFFQPIFNTESGKVEKFESLVRMIDEDGAVISPFYFLEVAKRAKLYPQITKLMIDHSIRTFHQSTYECSINMTLEDIRNPEAVEYFFEALATHDIGSQIVVELVESEGIENFEEIQLFIDRAREFGCKIAIDDFGTGYSNFEYLLSLKADYIKIDGSLIRNLDQEGNGIRFVAETVVSFARKAQMKTIAEFVSHEAISDIVKDMGVDYLQGYFIGEPMPFEKVKAHYL